MPFHRSNLKDSLPSFAPNAAAASAVTHLNRSNARFNTPTTSIELPLHHITSTPDTHITSQTTKYKFLCYQVTQIFTDFLFFKTLLCKFQRAGGADEYCIDTFNCQRMALQRKHEIHKEEHRTPNTELRTQNKRRGKTASLYNGAKLRVWSKKTLATEVSEDTEKR